MADGYWMDAKYPGRCAECNGPIDEGERIAWIPKQRAALCAECGPGHIGDDEYAEKPAPWDFLDKEEK